MPEERLRLGICTHIGYRFVWDSHGGWLLWREQSCAVFERIIGQLARYLVLELTRVTRVGGVRRGARRMLHTRLTFLIWSETRLRGLLLMIYICHIYDFTGLDYLSLCGSCSQWDLIRWVLGHECLLDASSLGLLTILVDLRSTAKLLVWFTSISVLGHVVAVDIVDFVGLEGWVIMTADVNLFLARSIYLVLLAILRSLGVIFISVTFSVASVFLLLPTTFCLLTRSDEFLTSWTLLARL